jgi:metal binding Ada-like protein
VPYTLIGRDGKPYVSATPGTLGGHRRNKIYGRLDCRGAAMWIARGHYVRQRVFFADEATAVAAGYRPCARCLPAAYAAWRQSGAVKHVGPPSPLSDSSEPS